MPDAYLTIDDSPSAETGMLTAWLMEKNIPALLFCRGDRLEKNPAAIVEAIRRGFTIGNHAWSHSRFSQLSFEEGVAEIEKTDALIDKAYEKAEITRPGKYFRFPHMDRGTGGWVVDYDAAPEHKDTLIKLFSDGLNIDLTPPSPDQIDKSHRLRAWLKSKGFTAPPFAGIKFDWYAETEMSDAIDAMFTYSTADWAVGPRHAGKWLYKNADDLKKKIDEDSWLRRKDSRHIILMHDQDDLFAITRGLLEHMQTRGVHFIAIGK
jgi:peptidoglycan-N-acetylglucosamine deacetylase